MRQHISRSSKRWLVAYATITLFGFLLGAAYQRRPHPAPPLPTIVVRDGWGGVIPRIDLSKPSLSQAIDELRRLSGADILVDWNAIAPLSKTTVVNADIHLRQVTLDQVFPKHAAYHADSGLSSRSKRLS